MHPLSGALPLPYVVARITGGALVVHQHSCIRLLAAELLSTTRHLCPSPYLYI